VRKVKSLQVALKIGQEVEQIPSYETRLVRTLLALHRELVSGCLLDTFLAQLGEQALYYGYKKKTYLALTHVILLLAFIKA
jgi:hypothetical protein